MSKTAKKRRFSIQVKLMILLLTVIIALTVAMAAVMYRNMRGVLMGEAVSEMNLFCRERGMEIDTQLMKIEDSVATVSQWLLRQVESLDSLDELSQNKDLRDKILNQAESMLLLSAKRIEGAETIYFRYPLDLVDQSEEGAFFVRNADGEFRKEPLTQVLEYDKNDNKHVGWYYLPIEAGEPMWMSPYLNENINVTMISYEEPVYCGTTLIGLIGMDIDFSRMVEDIDEIQYKETGYMYLKEADGSLHYHPSYLEGEDIHGDEEDTIISGSDEMEKSVSDEAVHYTFRGGDRVMVFMTLRNGMKLVLCDSYREIFRVANETLSYQMIIAIAMFAVAAAVMVLISSHITRPLRKLAAAANQLSTGDYEVEFPNETGDEVGDLTRAFRTAVEHLKQYSDDMEVLAYQDGLTRVKNVAAYKIEQSALNDAIESGHAVFAVVMLDLNYLKDINDKFGHSAGDIVLMRTAAIICRTFPLSAVYRIGGDEFTVILKDTEYECRSEKISELEMRIKTNNENAREPYMRISAAYGLAVYDADTDHSYTDVYRRADKKMYQMKQAVHSRKSRQA